MYLISAEAYENASVSLLNIRRTNEIWPSMRDIGSGLGVKNISDLVIKEIRGIYGEKNLTEGEIENYKMTEREIYEKFYNLSKDELNIKNNKNTFAKNNVMTNIIKHCRGEKKKRRIRAIDVFRKKIMIPDFEISKYLEHEVKSKIGSIFVNEKILEEKFYQYYKEKIQTDKNDCEYILFRIDIYFTEYFLAVEIDGKGHTDRDFIFEEKRQEALENKLHFELIRINTSKENYDADYEGSRIQTFISKFKDK